MRLLDEALSHGMRSIEVLSRLPPSDSIVLAHAYLCEVYLYRKLTAEAREHFDRAIVYAEELRLGWLKERLTEELGPKLGLSTA